MLHVAETHYEIHQFGFFAHEKHGQALDELKRKLLEIVASGGLIGDM